MTSRTFSGVSSLLALGFLLAGCGMAVSGAEYAEVAEAEYVEPTSYGGGGGGAPADFDGRPWDDLEEAEEKAGDDDAPESATEVPVGAGMYKGGGAPSDGIVSNPSNPPPMYALADDDDAGDDDNDDSAKPPRKDEVDVDTVTTKIRDAKNANDHVKIEEQVIDEGIKDADEINDELAKILEELRRQRGMQEQAPYVSPTQQVIDPIMEQGDERLQQQVVQQVQEQLQEEMDTAAPPDEEDEEHEAAAEGEGPPEEAGAPE